MNTRFASAISAAAAVWALIGLIAMLPSFAHLTGADLYAFVVLAVALIVLSLPLRAPEIVRSAGVQLTASAAALVTTSTVIVENARYASPAFTVAAFGLLFGLSVHTARRELARSGDSATHDAVEYTPAQVTDGEQLSMFATLFGEDDPQGETVTA